MKDILVDLYKIKNPYSGLGEFSTRFANELVTHVPEGYDISYLVPETEKGHKFGDQIKTVSYSSIDRYFAFNKKNYTIWHSLQQFPSFVPKRNSKWILTIHDLNFLYEKNFFKARKYLYRLQRNIDRADVITAVSNFTKLEIEKHLKIGNKKIHVIQNGVYSGAEVDKTKPAFIREGRKYFFSIGIFNNKKNFEVLIPLMKQFEDVDLIIAGNHETAYGKQIRHLVRSMGLEDRIILSGEVNNSYKQWLYSNCEALLFPSLAEGFGLPVIEAMYEGKPVFLSRHTSLPEIGGDKAFYFENFEAQDMAKVIELGLAKVRSNQASFELEVKEYASKFSWERCITAYVNLYKDITK